MSYLHIFFTFFFPHNCFFFFPCWITGKVQQPSCIPVKAGFTHGSVASSSQGSIWTFVGVGTVLKGTSAMLLRSPDTYPATTRPSVSTTGLWTENFPPVSPLLLRTLLPPVGRIIVTRFYATSAVVFLGLDCISERIQTIYLYTCHILPHKTLWNKRFWLTSSN